MANLSSLKPSQSTKQHFLWSMVLSSHGDVVVWSKSAPLQTGTSGSVSIVIMSPSPPAVGPCAVQRLDTTVRTYSCWEEQEGDLKLYAVCNTTQTVAVSNAKLYWGTIKIDFGWRSAEWGQLEARWADGSQQGRLHAAASSWLPLIHICPKAPVGSCRICSWKVQRLACF